MRLISLLVLCCILGSLKVQAQQLQDLWDKTAQYYKGFNIRDQAVRLAKQDSIAAQIKYKPILQAQLQQGLSSVEGTSGAFLPLPGVINISAGANLEGSSSTFNHFLSGTMQWDILNFGRKGLDKAISSTAIAQARLDQEVFQLDIQQQLSTRYIEYLYYQTLKEWFARHAGRYHSVLTITRGLAKGGLVPGADSLLASSSLKHVQSALLQVDGKAQGIKYLIKELSNTEMAEAGNGVELPFMTLMGPEETELAIHPLLKLKEQDAESLDLLHKRKAREVLPRVQLLGGLSNRSSGISNMGYVSGAYGDVYSDFANNYFVGVGATWNLQDLFRSKVDREKIALQLQDNRHEQELLTNELTAKQQQLKAELQASERGIAESKQSMDEAHAAFSLYRTRYEGGLISLSDLLQVQEILLKTEHEHLMAYLNYWQLMIKLSYQQADFNPLFNHF